MVFTTPSCSYNHSEHTLDVRSDRIVFIAFMRFFRLRLGIKSICALTVEMNYMHHWAMRYFQYLIVIVSLLFPWEVHAFTLCTCLCIQAWLCTRFWAWVQSEVIQTVFHNVKKSKMIRRGHVINIKVFKK